MLTGNINTLYTYFAEILAQRSRCTCRILNARNSKIKNKNFKNVLIIIFELN
jgi:hypothetical protein